MLSLKLLVMMKIRMTAGFSFTLPLQWNLMHGYTFTGKLNGTNLSCWKHFHLLIVDEIFFLPVTIYRHWETKYDGEIDVICLVKSVWEWAGSLIAALQQTLENIMNLKIKKKERKKEKENPLTYSIFSLLLWEEKKKHEMLLISLAFTYSLQ